jgi:hypothetical protein
MAMLIRMTAIFSAREQSQAHARWLQNRLGRAHGSFGALVRKAEIGVCFTHASGVTPVRCV